MLKRNSKVSIVILSYNSKKYFEGCLCSIKNQTYKNLELIVVDNGSTDGSREYIELQSKNNLFIFIKNSKNIGYASGNNVGIEKSTGDYVLLLNPDVILENNYIEKIVDKFQKNSDIGSITGKILKFKFKGNQIIKTDIVDTVGLKICKSHRVVEIGSNKKDRELLNDSDNEIFGVSAAAAMYRKKALDDVKALSLSGNYFDDSFFIYKEDIDLSWRLRHAGWKSYWVASAVAYHHRWETGTSNKKGDIISNRKIKSHIVNYYSYRNQLLMILKNQFMVNLIIYFPIIFLYELKKFIYLLLFEQKTLKGLIDFIKLVPLTIRKRNAILSKSKLKPSELRRWF